MPRNGAAGRTESTRIGFEQRVVGGKPAKSLLPTVDFIAHMGKVSARIDLHPDGPDVDMDRLRDDVEKHVPDGGEITETKTEELAFGVSKLIVQITLPDGEGGTEGAEHEFSEIEGVSQVESKSVTRL